MATTNKKFDWRNWAVLINNANPQRDEPTKILGIKYSNAYVVNRNPFPFKISTGLPLTGISFVTPDPLVTTPRRIEALILRLFAKTNYEALPDKTKVELGRYVIKPSELNLSILKKSFNYVFDNKSNRITKSWLKPIQDIILEKQLEKPKPPNTGKKLNKSTIDKWGNPEPFDDPLEDFISPSRKRSFVEALKREETRRIKAKAAVPRSIDEATSPAVTMNQIIHDAVASGQSLPRGPHKQLATNTSENEIVKAKPLPTEEISSYTVSKETHDAIQKHIEDLWYGNDDDFFKSIE